MARTLACSVLLLATAVSSVEAFGGQTGLKSACVYSNPAGGNALCRGFCGNQNATSSKACLTGYLNHHCCEWKPPVGVKMSCTDYNVTSQWGTCNDYKNKNWCTSTGAAGRSWKRSWGAIPAAVKRGCCACGGGRTKVTRPAAKAPNGAQRLTCSTANQASAHKFVSSLQATNACAANPKCIAVSDNGCDQKGPFFLCASGLVPSRTGCVFMKKVQTKPSSTCSSSSCCFSASNAKNYCACKGNRKCWAVRCMVGPPANFACGAGTTPTKPPTKYAAVGGRCADGFCENRNDCPQCQKGLTCKVGKGLMCAGTCYGKCAPSVVKVNKCTNFKDCASCAKGGCGWQLDACQQGYGNVVCPVMDAGCTTKPQNCKAIGAAGNEATCASEAGVCKCAGGQVKYGSGKHWSSYKSVTSTIKCTNEIFGDPAPNVRKVCICKKAATPAPTRPGGLKCGGKAVPAGCATFFDGCNSCQVSRGSCMCTEMFCKRMQPSKCTAYMED